ncbi:TonB family protein [Erythrobacter arachoides]|uniref:TonB family protein n=1 Tax=Aurantiacibacter arachoides TaxID=1850444 RepID=A0A844ZZ60_9SPHN|nr:energy transducer TonB [Aurantiacibacter arachoides]MXO92998.1 TonB family protein [Aurantiacibacter arachoides]GGD52803.1 hypothetical protein GCM10011411_10880 [Aurantiacibacter arachoides]
MRSHIATVVAALSLTCPLAAAAQDTSGTSPRPLASPGEWIDPQDYPAEALRQNAAGVTGVRLQIDPRGMVRKCTVVSSSGHAILDDTACLRLEQRGEFEPARDGEGNRTDSTWSTSVVWALPEAVRLPLPEEAHIEFTVDIDQTGAVTQCTVLALDLPENGPREDPCANQPDYYPATDEAGNPIPLRVRFRMELTREDAAR